MKKTIVWMLALLILAMPAALAVDMNGALAAAQALVGPDAQLVDQDMEGQYFEFEFRGDGTRYDVLIGVGTGAAVRLETDYTGIARAYNATLDEDAARAAVTALLPEAEIDYALLEKDDGNFEWDVFYALDGAYGVYAIQPETGEVLSTEVFYDVPADLMTASQAVASLIDARGDLTVIDIDLDIDDDMGGYRYDGKAQLNGAIYEFELVGTNGAILEWERD